MSRPTLALIAAVARNNGIGRAGELLWHESADQKHFRRVTMGCPVIMGRRTWESLPPRFRPLPGRRNIVISRAAAWQAEGAVRVASLDEALAQAGGAAKAFVIGGAEVYRLALPYADELVLTEVDADFDADVFFPPWNPIDFRQTAREDHVGANGITYRFATYQREKGR